MTKMRTDVSPSREPRVLHVSTVHPPFDARIYYKEARGLVDLGFDVSLAMTTDEPAQVEGVRIVPLGRITKSRLGRIGRNFRALVAMFKKPYDIIHIHDPELLLTSVPAIIFGRRLIYDVHEFYYERILRSDWITPTLRPLVARLYVLIERTILSRCAGAVVVTSNMFSMYEKFMDPRRLALVRNFPNLTDEQMHEARKTRPIKERYILHTGGTSQMRSFHTIVAVAEQMRAEGCNVPIINVGPVDITSYGNQGRSLLDRAKRADLRVLGKLGYPETLSWVAHADIGYISLPDTYNNREALPNKLFEYMRFGIPIVASSIGLIEKLIRGADIGLLVPPEAPNEHATAFIKLLNDPKLWDEKARASLTASPNFTFHAECKRLAELYYRILRELHTSAQ